MSFEFFKHLEKTPESNERGRDLELFSASFMSRWNNPEKEGVGFFETMDARNEGVLNSYAETDLNKAYRRSILLMNTLRKNPERIKNLVKKGEIAES